MIYSRRIVAFNIIIPLLCGGLVYLISSPDVIFVNIINTHIKTITPIVSFNSVVGRFLRNYLLDILWAYALVFAIYFIVDTAEVWRILVLTMVFSIILEAVQVFDFVPGTFDVWDILFEGIAETLAAIFIKIMRRQKSYEKQN